MLSPGTLDHTKCQCQAIAKWEQTLLVMEQQGFMTCFHVVQQRAGICIYVRQSMPSPYIGLYNCAVLLFAVVLASMGFAKQVHLWYSFLIFTCR